jgi:hypothetical protein
VAIGTRVAAFRLTCSGNMEISPKVFGFLIREYSPTAGADS